ncbi:hypothetical protein ACIOUE_01205 [Streptomyces xanthochromogenes]|uniref:hypothetical protein n=1 Tax=Streptomyces xanthochromogenes TaxID=67384 RepID=UPI003822017A
MIHHTGGYSSQAPVIDKADTCHMVGWGRANHAGLGGDDVLKAVIDERALLLTTRRTPTATAASTAPS